MKAVVYESFGPPDVLQLKEIDKPAPLDDEVLVKVQAASVNAMDWRVVRANPFFSRLMGIGLFKPKNTRLGSDLAGRVEAVGGKIDRFHPGDEVFGTKRGCFAEYVCVRQDALALKPAGLSFEEAAAVPLAALTALQGLRDKGHIQPGQKVLIQGAGGGVGTFAVQIAKAFGAEVTAVCSARNLDMARSLGADHVIDYGKDDFTKNGLLYDLILAVNGYHSIFGYKRALSPKGTCVVAGGATAQLIQAMLLGPLISKFSRKTLGFLVAKLNQKDLVFLKDLLEARTLVPVIEERYAMSQAAEALRHLEEGHARGKIVLVL